MKEHPDIYLPESKRPEPHFFLKDDEYSKGLEYYYGKYFFPWSGERAIGEASTSYIYQSYVPERIYTHLPGVKLIAILRNPVDRAYSNYWITVQNNLEKLSFEDAVQKEKERIAAPGSPLLKEIQPYAYIDRGYYYRQLRRYLKFFGREQLLILLFDDLQTMPGKVMKEVFHFLDVDQGFVPEVLGKVANKLHVYPKPMNPETRKHLINLFKEDNEKLSGLIGRDLAGWSNEVV